MAIIRKSPQNWFNLCFWENWSAPRFYSSRKFQNLIIKKSLLTCSNSKRIYNSCCKTPMAIIKKSRFKLCVLEYWSVPCLFLLFKKIQEIDNREKPTLLVQSLCSRELKRTLFQEPIEPFMTNYNSHAAAPTNFVMGQFFNALSAPFMANHKTRSSAPQNSAQEHCHGPCQDPKKTPQGAKRNSVEASRCP